MWFVALLATELHQQAYSHSTRFCKNLWLIRVFALVCNIVIMANTPRVSYVTEIYTHNISMRCILFKVRQTLILMSIYWNNVFMKKLSKTHKNKFKYKINTNIGRFYFYFKRDQDTDHQRLSGRLVFFPKKES